MKKIMIYFGIALVIILLGGDLLWNLRIIGPNDPSATRRALEGAGYTNIQTKGWAMFGCDGSDNVRTQFVALAPNGHTIKGVVCKGWGFWAKGSTIRTY